MMLWQRPPKPHPEFDDAVFDARATISTIAASRPPKSKDFAPHWGRFKGRFVEAQRGKCGFCEVQVIASQPGDVEHYRPKAILQELPGDRNQWGSEQPDGTRRARCPQQICEWGYHWLAYDWSNYLLACWRCNRFWKMNLFPVAECPRRLPPSTLDSETPLLLNPFDGPEPSQHLRFDEMGQIDAWDGSEHGRATIDTCYLDREPLRSARAEKARKTYQLLRRLRMELESGTVAAAVVAGADLVSLGEAEASHPGMVRAIVVQQTKSAGWEEFLDYIDGLSVAGRTSGS